MESALITCQNQQCPEQNSWLTCTTIHQSTVTLQTLFVPTHYCMLTATLTVEDICVTVWQFSTNPWTTRSHSKFVLSLEDGLYHGFPQSRNLYKDHQQGLQRKWYELHGLYLPTASHNVLAFKLWWLLYLLVHNHFGSKGNARKGNVEMKRRMLKAGPGDGDPTDPHLSVSTII